jgi:hypothetical protein
VFADADGDLRELATGHWAMFSAPEQVAEVPGLGRGLSCGAAATATACGGPGGAPIRFRASPFAAQRYSGGPSWPRTPVQAMSRPSTCMGSTLCLASLAVTSARRLGTIVALLDVAGAQPKSARPANRSSTCGRVRS